MAIVAPVMEDVVGLQTAGGGNTPDPAAVDSPKETAFGERVAAALSQKIGEQRYDLWFDRKTRFSLVGNALIVETPNAFSANWIRTKFARQLSESACEAAGRNLEVAVEVDPTAPAPAAPARTPAAELNKPHAGPRTQDSALRTNNSIINPKYTLEEFVVGPSNQMAYHAALKVADTPGQQFNPLFFHGNCGLGKTHLLQGICQRFARLHPTRKWLYITGEQFTNEFLEAIRNHKTDAFRRRIRSADLLVIDDVHFLANKKATQEEFLHTFNQVDASGKQIVLASDCAPRQIQSLSDQLSSRFVSGMVLRIDSPDLPTRLEILRRRVLRNNWDVSDAVLMHIAQSSATSVRELEGLLLQVIAGIKLINIGAPEAGTVLASIRDRTAMRGPVAVERIIAAVATHFSLQPSVLLGGGREKILSLARAICMYLARQHTGMSFPEIGRAMGNKNHSTVIAACQRVESLLLSGQVLCWMTTQGPGHQAMPDILHELEGAVRTLRSCK
jgi:chromosomal replication initiator protein